MLRIIFVKTVDLVRMICRVIRKKRCISCTETNVLKINGVKSKPNTIIKVVFKKPYYITRFNET